MENDNLTTHRALKNTLMVAGLAVVVGLTGWTIYCAANAKSQAQTEQTASNPQSEMSTGSAMNDSSEPPEKPDGESSSSEAMEKPSGESAKTTTTDNEDTTEPPEKPDGESSDSETMEKPDGETNSNSASEPPAKPSDDSSSNLSENNSTTTSDYDFDTIFWIFFIIEGVAFALLMLYLVMSRANRKTWHQTFCNSDRVKILVLAAIIVSVVYTLSAAVITFAAAANMTTTSNSEQTAYDAVLTISSGSDLANGTYTASRSDQLAILATGNITATLDNFTVNKTGDSDGGDNTSFYGTNSAILAASGANLTITNSTIITDAAGANGVFSFGGSATTDNNTTNSGDGTTVNISDSTITTNKDNSGGIMTTGGGVMNAKNLTINTAGTSSAAIRSDRGGGTVSVDQGTYTTTGQGSPAVYSTAEITVKNATLNSKTSEGVVIEGKNSVALENVKLTDNNTKLNGQSTTYKNIFLYQSMSGDAASGTATFSAKDSEITTDKGDSFYVTNTTAEIDLENNIIVNNDASGNFLRAQADSWGNSGSNGGVVTLNLTEQTASGAIVVDEISELTMDLEDDSTFTGAINSDNSAKSLTLTLSADSRLVLTADTYLTSFTNAVSDNSNVDFNGHKLYVNGAVMN